MSTAAKSPTALAIAVRTQDSVVILTADGALDSSSSALLRDSLTRATLEQPSAVIVNVTELQVAEESAWSVFISARWQADWSREQADTYMKSGGTEGTQLQGKPVILLTTVGAKTGKLRKTPLMRVEHDGQYAIVASLGGAPKNPVWYHNVVKNPRVELQDGTVTGDYDAREVFGDEKAIWWQRAVAVWPDYASYQTKTDRQIPVFVLTPVRAGG